MSNRILLVFIFLFFQNLLHSQDSSEIFTLYLVRHAEKDLMAEDSKDPPLTPCGQQRALALKHFLEHVDIAAIYSTDYIRTLGTASPVATGKGIEIQLYNPKELEDFAKQLKASKKDALVVGHSNSTSLLAGYLVGSEFESIDESVYDRIYQVVITKGEARLHLLQSSFHCDEPE